MTKYLFSFAPSGREFNPNPGALPVRDQFGLTQTKSLIFGCPLGKLRISVIWVKDFTSAGAL